MVTILSPLSSGQEGRPIQSSQKCVHESKDIKAQSTMLAVLSFILAGLSIALLVLMTPLTFAIAVPAVVILAVASLVCLVISCQLCVHKCNKIELNSTSSPERTLIENIEPQNLEINDEDEDEEFFLAPEWPLSEHSYTLDFRALYESNVFTTQPRVNFPESFSQNIAAKLSSAMNGLSTIIERHIQHEPVITSKEIGSLFFSTIHRWRSTPASCVAFDFRDLFSEPESGIAWLCFALKTPSAFNNFSKFLAKAKSWFYLQTIQQERFYCPIGFGVLVNCFLTGWIFPSEKSKITCLQAIDELPISQGEKVHLTELLDSGDVINALVSSYRYQNLPWESNENEFLDARCDLWSPSMYRQHFLPYHPSADQNCNNHIVDAVRMFSSSCASTWLYQLSAGKRFKALHEHIRNVWNTHFEFLATGPGALSTIITVFSELYKDASLQEKIKNLLPHGLSSGLEKFLSNLFLGAQTTGILTEEHVASLGEALACSPTIVQTMIQERLLAPTLLGKALA